jgi:hypothetical protein
MDDAMHEIANEPDRLLFGRGIGMYPVNKGFGAPDWLLHLMKDRNIIYIMSISKCCTRPELPVANSSQRDLATMPASSPQNVNVVALGATFMGVFTLLVTGLNTALFSGGLLLAPILAGLILAATRCLERRHLTPSPKSAAIND